MKQWQKLIEPFLAAEAETPSTRHAKTTFKCPNCEELRNVPSASLLKHKAKPNFGWCGDCLIKTRTIVEKSKVSKFSDDQLRLIFSNSMSFSDMMKKLGYNDHTGNRSTVIRRLKQLNLDTSELTNRWFNNLKLNPVNITKSSDDVFFASSKTRPKGQTLKNRLLGIGWADVCLICGGGNIWNGKRLVIQVDHIDGNPCNNYLENLRFICPNCHTQTSTFSNRKDINKICSSCERPFINKRGKGELCQPCRNRNNGAKKEKHKAQS